MATRDVLRTLGGEVNNVKRAAVPPPKVVVRNENDIRTLRRTFQSIYNGILSRISSEDLNSRTRTALLLRFSQLENSLFENIRRHTIIQTEGRPGDQGLKSNGAPDNTATIMEPFDTELQKTVDTMEAKLQALVKEVDDMRKHVPETVNSVRSLADELEKGLDESDDEDEENVGRELSADFNKTIYDALTRKVAMISNVVEELSDDVPQLISNSINDLQAAHALLNAPLSRVDAAMATQLTKRKRPTDTNGDSSETNDHTKGGDERLVPAKTPRTKLRDMILND